MGEKDRTEAESTKQHFRDWLRDVAAMEERVCGIESLLKRLDYVDSGSSFSREEMNAR